MFEKNLTAVREKNPKLAEKLEKIDINSITGIEVFKAESGDLIISYKNAPLHSSIDPVREAKTTWHRTVQKELKKSDIQIVFGLGLGYLFKRAYVSAESKIFIIEPFIEVLRFVLEHVDFSNELADSRVYITDNAADIYNKLEKEFLTGDNIEFLFLNHSAVLNQDLLQNMTSKTFEIMESRGNDENTIFNLSKFWANNFLQNIVAFPETRPLGFMEGKFADKTALILSAGPSLAYNLELIKENQDKFVTISVGKVFKTLVNAGITPDFAVFADARYCIGQTQGVEKFLKQTNLILLSKADSHLFNLKSKSKILYFSEIDSMARIFEKACPKPTGFYKSGSSVSIISYYVAKALGFSQIIFSGLDLAYIDNKFYAKSDKIFEEFTKCFKLKFQKKYEKTVQQNSEITWLIKQLNNICFKDETYIDILNTLPEEEVVSTLLKHFQNILQNQDIITVKDTNGNDILTRADYAWFIRQFSEIFTEEINLARIINTSPKGAYIEGMEYMELSEALKTTSGVKPNVDKIISSVYSETKEIWDSTITNIYKELKRNYDELEKINTDSTELYKELDSICIEIKQTGKTDYNPEAFNNVNKKIIETRQMLIGNVFASNAMQKEIWNYTKNYSTKPIPTREDIIANLELDRELFKTAKEESENLTVNIKKTLTILEEKQGVLSK